MKNEIFWLVSTIIVSSLFWVPYILDRIFEHKLIPALRNPNRDSRPKSQWANRLMYAHENAVENMVLFAPLVILVLYLDLSTSATITAAMIYFYARVAHVLLYTFGVPYLRTLAYFVGWLAQLYLAIIVLSSFT
ncbi:MAG: MAPEG family protein [Xanthomonadales bacterium]|nr:MAPEG family protein [Xanthomonadales bacterium]